MTPYTDDPDANEDPSILLQTQQRMMNTQDEHLDRLSHSINRQRDLSIQINDELDVHHGLLSELDTDINRTHDRMSGARRRLDRFAKGAKNNGACGVCACRRDMMLTATSTSLSRLYCYHCRPHLDTTHPHYHLQDMT